MDLLKHLNAKLNGYSSKPWVVGFSGGCDSTVLLYLLVKLRDAQLLTAPLSAVHVNHQLHSEANGWAAHCKAVADEWQVPITIEPVTVINAGKGIEAAARDARFDVFEQHLQEPGHLLLAHHQDDQAETLLLRLMRGAGIAGLASMSESRPLAKGQLLRPLLGVSRQQISAFAETHCLSWIDDPSNQRSEFDRNFLRNEVLPLLQNRWPNALQQISNSAAIMGQARDFVEHQADAALAELKPNTERLGQSVDALEFSQLDKCLQTEVIRLWCRQLHLPVPDFKSIQCLHRKLLQVQGSGQLASWSGVEIRYFVGRLYLLPTHYQEPIVPGPIQSGTYRLNQYQSLELFDSQPAATVLLKKTGNYRVSYRVGGERCRPSWRAHSQTLKKLLQEVGLETWLREQVPIIYCDKQIAAVGDLWVCDEFAAAPGQPGYRLTWSY